VTLAGHQSEIVLQTRLQSEVEAERLTRLDKMFLAEQHDQGVIDPSPVSYFGLCVAWDPVRKTGIDPGGWPMLGLGQTIAFLVRPTRCLNQPIHEP
jgi:hypothetical protein